MKGYCRQLIDAIIARNPKLDVQLGRVTHIHTYILIFTHNSLTILKKCLSGLTKIFMKKQDLDVLEVYIYMYVCMYVCVLKNAGICKTRVSRKRVVSSMFVGFSHAVGVAGLGRIAEILLI